MIDVNKTLSFNIKWSALTHMAIELNDYFMYLTKLLMYNNRMPVLGEDNTGNGGKVLGVK